MKDGEEARRDRPLLSWRNCDHICHGPARGHALALGQPAIPRFPTVEVGNRDVSLEAHSIQDLEELADVAMLWDVRDRATAVESRQETDG